MFTVFLAKNGETNQTIFQRVCTNDLPMVEDSVQVNIFLYEVVFVDEAMIGSLLYEQLANNPTLFDNCKTPVTFVMYPSLMLFVKLNVAHRFISFPISLESWRSIKQLAGNQLGIFSPKTCISSVKH